MISTQSDRNMKRMSRLLTALFFLFATAPALAAPDAVPLVSETEMLSLYEAEMAAGNQTAALKIILDVQRAGQTAKTPRRRSG